MPRTRNLAELRETEEELLDDIDTLEADIKSTLVGTPQRAKLQAAYQTLAITRLALTVAQASGQTQPRKVSN